MNFKENESAQKLRGGYYTPEALAQYLSEWVAEIDPQKVLEPSCGDGIFLTCLARLLRAGAEITGIELEEGEAATARSRCLSNTGLQANIVCADFLEWHLDPGNALEKFDAVVGNPPFIRYQYLEKKDQTFSEMIFASHRLKFTKHTNAWVPFVIASVAMLRPGGRLAMVLPAEILHVLHADSLRCFLGKECSKITIIDPEDLWFSGVLQGAVLLLAEKKKRLSDHPVGLGIVRTAGTAFLGRTLEEHQRAVTYLNGKTVEGKWTRALLDPSERLLLERAAQNENVHRFEDVAKVDVGIVTGANKFFLVPRSVTEKYKLQDWAYPMFGRSEHCPGVIYDQDQHSANEAANLPSDFLWFNVTEKLELDRHAKRYVASGEQEGLHTRYKCRIREPWFRVPSVYATEVGMLKRCHDLPRLIYNSVGAYTTDTAYRITSNSVSPKRLVGSFVNSLTALSAELEGRHYGGGVLELVPSEIERLMVPLHPNAGRWLSSIDTCIRKCPTSEVLDIQDRRVLGPLGFTQNDLECLREGWKKMKDRRQRIPKPQSIDMAN